MVPIILDRLPSVQPGPDFPSPCQNGLGLALGERGGKEEAGNRAEKKTPEGKGGK